MHLGQTQLLINKKFTFFENFLKKAEEEKELEVNNDDLQGLWDMIYLEISDLDVKYKELETLKSNNWKRPAVVLKSPKNPTPKKTHGYIPVRMQRGVIKSTGSASPDTSSTRTTPQRPASSFTKSTTKTPLPSRPKSSIPTVANTGSNVSNRRSTYTLAMPADMASSSSPVNSPKTKPSRMIPRKTLIKNQTSDSTKTVTRPSASDADEYAQSSDNEEYYDARSSLSLSD